MRYTIYKNSILATICSMTGAVCIVLAVTSLFSKELDFFSALAVAAVGGGLMWLASVISERKAKRKQAKAAAQQNPNAAKPQREYSAQQEVLKKLQGYKAMLERGDITMDEYERKLQALKKQQDTQLRCAHCGHVNSADSRFCAGCGSPISKPKPPQGTCSHCGHVNSADSRFCASCGRPISR